jgi:hypothetical protein
MLPKSTERVTDRRLRKADALSGAGRASLGHESVEHVEQI